MRLCMSFQRRMNKKFSVTNISLYSNLNLGALNLGALTLNLGAFWLDLIFQNNHHQQVFYQQNDDMCCSIDLLIYSNIPIR